MVRFRFVITLFVLLGITACTSNPPAPVIERNTKPTTSTKPAKTKPTTANKDWRPDSYTVKKGDTLYSIGLEFGYDYKEIAASNNIQAPYGIKVGQQLKFAALKDKADGVKSEDIKSGDAIKSDNGVVITPMKIDPVNSVTVTDAPKSPIMITEPKTKREPYSLEALNRPVAVATIPKPADINKPNTEAKANTDTKPEVKPEAKTDTKAEVVSDEEPVWTWPTKGKVIGNFNENNNKGIDIAGTEGQTISAAAAGKVIYSGSDLRGYGKLVIIKHNKTFLSVYAHNSKIVVKEGQQITRGQKIAEMGSTDSDKVALHFEIRQQGKSVDPAKFLTQ